MEGPVFREIVSPVFALESKLTAVYNSGRSKFQDMHVINTAPWGRCLILDGKIQSAEYDEFVYHESLVHPAMISHPNPKKVFIAGGGEGATLREVLRHKSVEECVMVDIDGDCVQFCRNFMPDHHGGAFDDKRTTLVIDDALAYLENTKEKFDVYIGDLCDPVEGNPAKLLYSVEYYKMLTEKLNPDAVFVTQSGPAGILSHNQVYTAINKTLSQVFPNVHPFKSFVPSFVDEWGFNMTSPNASWTPVMSSKNVDRLLAERIGDTSVLKYYDGVTHQAMFSLPKKTRNTMANEDRIITRDTPLVIP